MTQNCKSSFFSTVWNGGAVLNHGNIDTASVLRVPSYTYAALPNAIEVCNEQAEKLMTISGQGEVVFHKTPNKAAEQLVNLCYNSIDIRAASLVARQRSYRRGVEKCLRLARVMEKDQLIDLLEQEVNVRLGSEMLHRLQDEGTE